MYDQNNEWLKLIIYAVFAGVGGFLAHIVKCLENNSPISRIKCIVAAFASGFVGILMVLLCTILKLDMAWTGLIVGVSGWLGAEATIQGLSVIVRKKLGIEKDTRPDNHI